MRILWVTRSFLDYRIPVYKAVSDLVNNDFYLIFSKEPHANPPRVVNKAKDIFHERAIALTGEICIGKPYKPDQPSNSVIRYFHQPGLRNTILALQPDIIITDAFNHWTVPVLCIRLFSRRIKHVMCYERTKHTERNIRWYKKAAIKLSFKAIDAINCNGIQCKEFLTDLGYPTDKVSLGNMAADTEILRKKVTEFSNYQRALLSNKLKLTGKVFLYLGRLVPLKGVNKLIDSWIQVFHKDSNLHLLIVGDGSEKEALKASCKERGSLNIHFIGNVDYDNVYKFLSISDILIMPTLEDNWSLVVPEAMSAGLPIICSKYNGCWPELVRQENGWVFDPLDRGNFIKTLQDSWDNREKWQEMGRESLRIIQNYTPVKVANSIFSSCIKVSDKQLIS